MAQRAAITTGAARVGVVVVVTVIVVTGLVTVFEATVVVYMVNATRNGIGWW